jgi:8-oxo-dGTP pyrophosphatase MutT (NUDIX family)
VTGIARKELEAVLSAYRSADGAEEESLARLRALVRDAPDPFTRDVRDHVTASAVVARPDGAAFLLIHHRRLDRWLQPGGHVEPEDASVFAAARREAREETGVEDLAAPFGDRVLDVDVHPIPARRNRPAHVHFDVRHLLTTTATRFVVAADEVRRAEWFTFEQAIAAGADTSLVRALRKAVALLGGG